MFMKILNFEFSKARTMFCSNDISGCIFVKDQKCLNFMVLFFLN